MAPRGTPLSQHFLQIVIFFSLVKAFMTFIVTFYALVLLFKPGSNKPGQNEEANTQGERFI